MTPSARTVKLYALLLLILVMGGGCTQKSIEPLEPMRLSISPGAQKLKDEPTAQESVQETDVPDLVPEPFIDMQPAPSGSSEIARPSGQKDAFSNTETVSAAVDSMDMTAFIHYVFSEILQANYIIDETVKNSKAVITLNLNRKLTKQQLYSLSVDVLQQYGVAVIKKENTFFIWSGAAAAEVNVGFGRRSSDVPMATGTVHQYIPLIYGNAAEMNTILPEIPQLNRRTYSKENLIIASGTRDKVLLFLNSLRKIDVPAMAGRHIGMQRIVYWPPEELAEKLSEILINEGVPVQNDKDRGLRITVLERWNSLLFFAGQKEWLDRAKYWLSVLDKPEETDNKHFYIYYPENSKATELFDSLSNIMNVTQQSLVDEPDHPKTALQERRTVAEQLSKEPEPTESPNVSKIRNTASQDDDGPNMSVDEHRNAIILYATPQQYAPILSLLKRLDVMPVQVLLEASVAEVTLTGSLQYGLEWYIKNTSGEQTSILSTLAGLGLGSGGLDYSLITDAEKFKMLINALAQEGLVKILQSPRLTVRDGMSATMNVGTEVPVITSEASAPDVQSEGSSSILRSVQYRSTGVTLNVTPSVHSSGVVTLQINQQVSEAQANTTSNINSPIILNRSFQTEVVAGDNQTVMLGGLIRENDSVNVNKVPLLGDIPWLGRLFRTDSIGSNRTELVVLITPRIIRSMEQIDDARKALFDEFRHLRVEEPVSAKGKE